MKQAILIAATTLALVGCGTVKGTAGGFFEGASQDFKSISTTIKGQ